MSEKDPHYRFLDLDDVDSAGLCLKPLDTGIAMKKIILPLSLILMSAACAPKDVEVIARGQRDKINQSKPGNKVAAAGEVLDFGSFGLTAYLMEKQGEALQVLSTSNLTRMQAAGPYIVDEATPVANLQKILISAINFTNKMNDFSVVQNAKWRSIIERNDNGSIIGISARAMGADGNVQLLAATDSSKFSDHKVVVFEAADVSMTVAADDATSSDVSYISNGTLSISKFGTTEEMPFSLKIQMRVKSNSFQESTLEITRTNLAMTVTRFSGKVISAVAKSMPDQVILFKNEKDCPAIVGKAAIDPKKQIIFDENSAYVVGAGKYKTTHAACGGQRPTVDLSRLLVY